MRQDTSGSAPDSPVVRFFNTYEPVTTFYRDLVPYLAETGLRCEVLLSAAEYRAGRGRLEEALAVPNVRVRRMPAGVARAGGRMSKLFVMAGYMVSSAVVSLFGRRRYLNFFLTQPPLFSMWGYVLKRLRGQRYCCLIMDLYPDLAVRDGMLATESLFTRLLTRMSRFALTNADAVLVIGRCMREHLVDAGLPAERVHLLTNWSDEGAIGPVADNPMRRELGLEDRFVVLYSGNLGMSHAFDDVLEVADRLRNIDDLRFVFIGHGARRDAVEREALKRGLPNVMFLPFQPVSKLGQSLSLGDAHLITLRTGFEGLVVPSKAYGCLAAGRAIVYQGDPGGEIARMIEEEGVGVVAPLGDPDALERAVVGLYNDRPLTAAIGARARRLAEDRYSRARSLSRYREVLGALLVATETGR